MMGEKHNVTASQKKPIKKIGPIKHTLLLCKSKPSLVSLGSSKLILPIPLSFGGDPVPACDEPRRSSNGRSELERETGPLSGEGFGGDLDREKDKRDRDGNCDFLGDGGWGLGGDGGLGDCVFNCVGA
jgi:hypothetical protein